jgi:hypothetical protein
VLLIEREYVRNNAGTLSGESIMEAKNMTGKIADFNIPFTLCYPGEYKMRKTGSYRFCRIKSRLSAAGLTIEAGWFMEDPLSGQRFLDRARKFVTSSIMEEYVTVPKREKG